MERKVNIPVVPTPPESMIPRKSKGIYIKKSNNNNQQMKESNSQHLQMYNIPTRTAPYRTITPKRYEKKIITFDKRTLESERRKEEILNGGGLLGNTIGSPLHTGILGTQGMKTHIRQINLAQTINVKYFLPNATTPKPHNVIPGTKDSHLNNINNVNNINNINNINNVNNINTPIIPPNSPVRTETKLMRNIEDMINRKFGGKGKGVTQSQNKDIGKLKGKRFIKSANSTARHSPKSILPRNPIPIGLPPNNYFEGIAGSARSPLTRGDIKTITPTNLITSL